jgi:CHASE2 domain-containing sensor protein
VIVGTVAAGFNDTEMDYAYSGGWKYRQRLSEVEVQAHMTSQLISAVLDDRPLIGVGRNPLKYFGLADGRSRPVWLLCSGDLVAGSASTWAA